MVEIYLYDEVFNLLQHFKGLQHYEIRRKNNN